MILYEYHMKDYSWESFGIFIFRESWESMKAHRIISRVEEMTEIFD